jgi:hypothetical protein
MSFSSKNIIANTKEPPKTASMTKHTTMAAIKTRPTIQIRDETMSNTIATSYGEALILRSMTGG